MLALLAGGTIGGFFGLLMAVPAAAVLKILVGHAWRTYVLNEPIEVTGVFAERDDAGGGVVEDVIEGHHDDGEGGDDGPEPGPDADGPERAPVASAVTPGGATAN